MAKGLARKPRSNKPPGALDQWVASLGFWIFATIAVGLAGASLLLPRLHEQQRLVHEAQALKNELVLLRDGNTRMMREAEALKRDPFYIAQTARKELGYQNPSEKRIRVTTLSVETERTRGRHPDDMRWLGWLERLYTRDETIRRASLCVAAVLLLCACLAFSRSGSR